MVRLLGEGGFGEVYLVQNPLIQRRAAVKVLHTDLGKDGHSPGIPHTRQMDGQLVRLGLLEGYQGSAIAGFLPLAPDKAKWKLRLVQRE